MSNILYIQLSSQVAADDNSIIAGILTYQATGVLGQPQYQPIYDYGATDSETANINGRYTFTGDVDARAYYDSIAESTLLASANSAVSAGYYTSTQIELVASPVYTDFSSLASIYVPQTTQVNGFSLSANVTLGKSDVGLGNVPNVDATNASNIGSGTLSSSRLPTSGVTAGTYSYSSVTVDSSGRVTGASSGTTPTAPQVYDGTTQHTNAFAIFFSGTTNGSGQVVINLTNDGTSTGTALFPTGPINKSVNFIVPSTSTLYLGTWAWSNSNKTLTFTLDQTGSTNVLTSLLGALTSVLGSPVSASSGVTLNGQVWGY